jgi:hypothetical protein
MVEGAMKEVSEELKWWRPSSVTKLIKAQCQMQKELLRPKRNRRFAQL